MDLDNDGIKDLFFGHPSGGLMHFKGKGNLVFDPVGDGKLQSDGKSFTMSYYAFPEIVDWNEDGLWDLVAHGKHNWDNAPNLLVFINEGTANQYVFGKEKQYQEEGGIGFPYIEPRVVPTIADFDYDGKKDILLGAANGELHFYSNKGTNSAPLFDFDSKVVVENDNGKYWTQVLPELKPDIADLNGDGTLDVITGGCGGGKGDGGGSELEIYISYGYDGPITNNKNINNNGVSCNFQNQFNIAKMNGKYRLFNNSNTLASISIFNMRGSIIVTDIDIKAKESLAIDKLKSGNFYILRINSSYGNSITKKLMILK